MSVSTGMLSLVCFKQPKVLNPLPSCGATTLRERCAMLNWSDSGMQAERLQAWHLIRQSSYNSLFYLGVDDSSLAPTAQPAYVVEYL